MVVVNNGYLLTVKGPCGVMRLSPFALPWDHHEMLSITGLFNPGRKFRSLEKTDEGKPLSECESRARSITITINLLTIAFPLSHSS